MEPISYLWLLSDPASAGGLRTLLEAASGRAARSGCRRITAGDGCGVCPARHGVPASWTHLGAALEDHGFAVTSQSAMMHARLTDLHDGAPADIDGLSLEWRDDPEVPEWELVARVGGRQVGECQAWGLSRHLADHREYRRWVIVEWIEVAESHRRRGIVRRLVSEQMRAHAQRGGTDALLQVFLPDPDALRFHEVMGFSVIETGTTYRKDGLQGTDR